MQGQLLAVLKGATSDQNDVANAYYRGTPLSYDEGGRVLFCHIPGEWAELGYDLYDENGERNMLEVVGNVPGRQEAGKIWGEECTRFLLSCGLSQ